MQNSYNNHPQQGAGFFVRLAAFIIDNICIGIVLLMMRFTSTSFFNSLGYDVKNAKILFEYTIVDIFLYLVLVLYFIVITYCTGTTIGKKLLNLQVVHVTGTKLSWFTVIYRETVGRFLSGLFMSIGYILIGIDKENRALHDFLSDTRVVYTIPKMIVVQAPNPVVESENINEA